MTQISGTSAGADVSGPAPVRIYDYMLRGSNHFDVDVRAARQIVSAVPEIQDGAWSNRGFHQRAAKWMAERGVRQFLDIGSGLPTVGNTHEVVQQVMLGARVVYVDNDPMVAEHADRLPGSYMALSHLTDDHKPPLAVERFRAVFDDATERLYFRSGAEIARFFDSLEMVPPYEGAEPGMCYTGLPEAPGHEPAGHRPLGGVGAGVCQAWPLPAAPGASGVVWSARVGKPGAPAVGVTQTWWRRPSRRSAGTRNWTRRGT